MKTGFATLVAVAFVAGPALAQGGAASGRGAVTGDPAASSASPRGFSDHGVGDKAEPKRQRHVDLRWPG